MITLSFYCGGNRIQNVYMQILNLTEINNFMYLNFFYATHPGGIHSRAHIFERGKMFEEV